MVVTFPATHASSGLRRIDPNKDFPQLVTLLRLVFGQEAGGEGQLFANFPAEQNPAILWRFDPNLARLSPGFVWELDNKIIGNVTLLPSRPPGRFLVANVAVHPDYRRQGYARLLMNAVVQDVQNRQGREILLQVERENATAISLYRSIGFESLGSMTTWQSSVSRIHDLAESVHLHNVDVFPLPRSRWREAYQLDLEALDPNLRWPEPLRADYYKKGIFRRLFAFMNGYQTRTYVTFDGNDQLSGLLNIHSEWGQPHQMVVRVHPNWRGRLEYPLLNNGIRLAHNLFRRNIRMLHDADDGVMNQLLPSANFRRQRTLTHMRLNLE